MKLKKCPRCDSKRIREETGEVRRTICGKKMVIPNVTYWHCLSCKEKIFPALALRKMEEFLKQRAA